jgi:glycosyltransferase involved in cell wall biosynthesis
MLRTLKIVLLANTDWYLANFRFDLACTLRDKGGEVHCIAPSGKYLDWLAEQGFQTHALQMGNKSYSPLDNWKTLQHLQKLYRQIKPDLAHHFTPRCVVLGSMAARKTGVPRFVNALTGLGHVFTSTSLKSMVARPALRGLLKRNLNGNKHAVIFQNQEDRDELATTGVVDAKRCHLIRGSGVNPEYFQPAQSERDDNQIRVLFASRLIGEKGIKELVVAMGEVVKVHPNAVLWVAGEPYAQNPTSLTTADLQVMGKQSWLKLFGHVDDMLPLLQQSDIVALPSYREGTPKILLEAASCALPIVATDIPGCRGVVEDGENGYLVSVRDSVSLQQAILKLCEDADSRVLMGKRGREIIQGGFSSEIVIRNTLDVYSGLLNNTPA